MVALRMIFTYNLAQRRYHMSVLSLFLLGPPRLEIDGTSLSVDTRTAVALYQNDFLAGFSLRDSPQFDDWQLYQSDTLRRAFASALEGLTHCHSAAHHFDTALIHARSWLALDRLYEPAHRQLMLLYAWAGQRTTALHQYRECVQTLEQELGVSPLESTTRLYQLIKANQIPPLPPPSPAPVFASKNQQTSSTATPDPHHVILHSTLKNLAIAGYPLVGRAEEWAKLRKTYHASED